MYELRNVVEKERNYISILNLTNDEIQKIRQNFIGASDAPAIIGVNKFSSPLDVFLEKTGSPLHVPFKGNNRTKWGLIHEDAIAQAFAEEKGFKVRRDNKIRIHPEYDFISCSLDRILFDPNRPGEPGILEIKTIGLDYFRSLECKLPIAYEVQTQQQFAVTGFTWGYVVMLVDNCNLHEFNISPDKAYIDLHIRKMVNFWNNYVVKNVPPAFSILDIEKDTFRYKADTMIECNEEILNKHKRYSELNKEVKDKTKELEMIKAEIKEYMQDKEKLIYQKKVLANWNSKINFDSTRFKEENPELYQEYQTKEIKSFYVKETKSYV